MGPWWSLADLVLGLSLCVNLLCLYYLCARGAAPASRLRSRRNEGAVEPRPPACRAQAAVQPGKERRDMEPNIEVSSEEEQVGNSGDSEEEEEGEENQPLQLSITEGSLKEVQDRNTSDAGPLCNWMAMEEESLPFLKEFPAQKEEIESCIRGLRETAQAISKTHKDCTIANITASSAGLTSGVLTILGLTLTPITAGASLILTATGLGLGAAAATTGVSAHISERIINSKHSKQSEALIQACEGSLHKCKESLAALLGLDETELDSPPRSDVKQPIAEKPQLVLEEVALAPQIRKVFSAVEGIQANVQALKLARANPALKVLAKRAAAAGPVSRASLKGVKQVQAAFKGTPLALAKGTRVLGAVTAGLFILYDTVSLVQDAIHLATGAEAEKATKIREEADKLEKALQNFNEQYEELKKYLCAPSWQ